MSAGSKRPRVTSSRDDNRRNPRYPKSRVWTEEERERHREERDATIEKAGLLTDRQLGDAEGKSDGS